MFGCEANLQAAIQAELENANRLHPPFASLHEGYAVMLEELDEAEEALVEIKYDMRQMWGHIKCDSPEGAEQFAWFVRHEAENLCREAIQVAAMARKMVARCEMR